MYIDKKTNGEKKIPIFTTFIQKKYSDKYHKKYSK